MDDALARIWENPGGGLGLLREGWKVVARVFVLAVNRIAAAKGRRQ